MKVLCVVSHFDDETLSAGGTLASFVQSNHEVFVLVTSRSDYSDYKGNVLRTIKQASDEGLESLRTLRIYNVTTLSNDTKKVPYNSDTIEKINKIYDNINPDIVITHHLSDSHHDHFNTAKATLSAVRRCNNIWMMESLYPSNQSNTGFNPKLYVDITKTIDLKIKAIKKHKSQLSRYGNNWLELVKARAVVRGIEIGCKYAECFEPIKTEYKIP